MSQCFCIVSSLFISLLCCEQKLIVETLEELWFSPLSMACQDVNVVIARRASTIIDIMKQCRTAGYISFEQLLENVSRFASKCDIFAFNCCFEDFLNEVVRRHPVVNYFFVFGSSRYCLQQWFTTGVLRFFEHQPVVLPMASKNIK